MISMVKRDLRNNREEEALEVSLTSLEEVEGRDLSFYAVTKPLAIHQLMDWVCAQIW